MSAWSNSSDVMIDFARMVMQKFRRLIEKRGVVLVAFQHKFAAAAQAEAAAKIFGDSADQKIRTPPA